MDKSPPVSTHKAHLAIIVPCYNEENSVDSLIVQIQHSFAMQDPDLEYRLIFVDDGSIDNTWTKISAAASQSDFIIGLRLSRNFGHQKALLAGLEFSVQFADFILSMDCDLQHPPQVARQMVDMAICENHEIISAQRVFSVSEISFKNLFSSSYYHFLRFIGVGIDPNVSDFRLLSKKAALAMISHGDMAFFPRGIVSLIGFSQALISYSAAKRNSGKSRYTIKKMLNLAADGISSLSIVPLRLAFAISVAMLLLCILMSAYVIIVYLGGQAIPGWASVALPMYALFGVNFMILGLLGEYIGRAYIQTLGRPRYIIRDSVNSDSVVNGEKR